MVNNNEVANTMFDLNNNKVKIRVEALTIPQFKKIWDNDKSKDKNKAFKELAYVYHMGDPKSPYANLSISDREYNIKEYILLDLKYEITEDMVEALATYKKLNKTVSSYFLEGVQESLHKLSTYLINVNIVDGSGGNINQILNTIKKGEEMLISFSNLQKKVESELIQKRKIRGGVKPSSIL